VLIRPERPADIARIRIVNLRAFETSVEADIVEALRDHVQPLVSLVAEDGEGIVGHVLFSPVSLSNHHALRIMGLGPMAVVPERQRQGVGTALVDAGLEQCRRLGVDALVVLGHADYYPRFGFTRASHFGIRCEFDVPDAYFMVRELNEGSLAGTSGTIHYHPVFATG
jgi:putative acetyltransferase